MKSKIFWKKWVKNLDESKLKALIKNDDILEDLPENLYKKQMDIIDNKLNIKKKIKIQEDYNFYNIYRYRYAAAFSILFIFFIILIFISFNFYKNKFNKNNCYVNNIKGNVYKLNKNKKLKNNKKIFENDILITNKNSSVKINISASSIKLNENSKISIDKLLKNKNFENTVVTLYNGYSDFNINKKNNNFLFSVITENLIIKVTGTEFSVNITDDNSTKIFVKKGKISITPKIKIDNFGKIENEHPEFAAQIKNTIEEEIYISSGEKFELSYKKIEEIEFKISEIISNTIEKFDNKSTYEKHRIIKESLLECKKIINGDTVKNNKIDKKSYLKILSPQPKYYESNPILKYDEYNMSNIKVHLNNKLIKIENDSEIKNLVTGFNNIKITSLNQSGEEVTNESNFFINKLLLKEKDNFNRLNNENISNNWEEYEGTDQNNDNVNFGNIFENKIIYKGPVENDKTWCSLEKEYNAEQLDEIILIIDIIKFDMPISNNNYMDLSMGIYIFDNWHESIDTVIYSEDGVNFDFFMKEIEIVPEVREIFITPRNNIIKVDFTKPKRLLYYKNGSSFYSLILNNDNTIYNQIQKTNYVPHFINSIKEFKKIKITCFINNNTENSNSFVEIDNFYFYSK